MGHYAVFTKRLGFSNTIHTQRHSSIPSIPSSIDRDNHRLHSAFIDRDNRFHLRSPIDSPFRLRSSIDESIPSAVAIVRLGFVWLWVLFWAFTSSSSFFNCTEKSISLRELLPSS
ncbi:hypothetical protein L6452_17142 [Arctium lappa]|uniref:Uncharacterized protein n=1 Tax=Arctium lappa TaxID=4217 RepID=A0ACB9C2R9_ARCLA|nr:hypothetical protein L6452_17142 [Arctium lappa]